MVETITYYHVGMILDVDASSVKIAYDTKLAPTDTVLPKFTAIQIDRLGDPGPAEFRDGYAESRLLSLVHYWLALIEDPARNLDPFREVLAEDFSLNFSSGAITDEAAFEAWFRGPASAVAASTHQISNFSYAKTDENTYTLMVDFDWQGILPNDAQMVAKTRHSWTVEDDVTERFARIKTVNVEILEPFAPKAD